MEEQNAVDLTEHAHAIKRQQGGDVHLDGFCCPHCGNGDHFSIEVKVWADFRATGSEIDANEEYEDQSPAICCGCDHVATVDYFTDPRNIAVLAIRLALSGSEDAKAEAKEIAEIAIQEIASWRK